MTDRPYTYDDLCAEAASQLASLGTPPTIEDSGRSMRDAWVDSTRDAADAKTWGDLLPLTAGFATAQQEIHDLINGAADTSEWAVRLGVEGLEPSPNTLSIDGDGKPLIRLQLAFHPGMDDDARNGFTTRLAQVLAEAL
jgi:hypothetical protein